MGMGVSIFALMPAVFVGGFVQGTIGFGFGHVVVPILIFVAPEHVPSLVLVLALPLTGLIAARERERADMRGVGWITCGRLVGTGAAIALLVLLRGPYLKVFFGSAVLGAAILSWTQSDIMVCRKTQVGAGAVAGLFGTAAGLGGPPLAMLYQRKPGAELRSTLSVAFMLGSAISLLALAWADRLSWRDVVGALQLAPAMIAGMWTSRVAIRREQPWLRGVVLVISGSAGLLAIVHGSYELMA